MCSETNHRHPADHRVRQNGPWIHEALARRPDCFIKGRYVTAPGISTLSSTGDKALFFFRVI